MPNTSNGPLVHFLTNENPEMVGTDGFEPPPTSAENAPFAIGFDFLAEFH
jgi:hypothetical protein